MLLSLYIRHFLLVKEMELHTQEGMTAFTGETGAGKSIIIDALSIALGGKATASVIRQGQEKCEISAVFQVDEGSEPHDWLNAHDLSLEQGEVMVRRVLYREGRSKAFIQGQPFPLQKLKALGERLVHIHSQHQHQALLQHSTHRKQLDQYAKHTLLQEEVEQTYQQCQAIKEAQSLLLPAQSIQDKQSLIAFQLQELEALALQEGEMERLHQEHQHLQHAKDYWQWGQEIVAALQGDEQTNVCNTINQLIQKLNKFPANNALHNAKELLQNVLIFCEETQESIEQYLTNLTQDPEALQELEARMSALHQIARKYKISPKDLYSLQQKLLQESQMLQEETQKRTLLEKTYQEKETAYQKAASILQTSRKQYAQKLSQEINTIIHQLGMSNANITLAFTPLETMQPHGLDKIEYQVCTNPGSSPDNLGKIASGGELSRISLAIQMVTAQRGATPTLIFDEVDVGIGGAQAALVGQLLRRLSERLQVFCVTHQPQVASKAHEHVVVEKQYQEKETYSFIKKLTTAEKIEEIARMIGGITVTAQTLSHAKELLEL